MAEAMRQEMQPFGIQVQTINPGAFLTGFNEAMAENAFRWLDDNVNFTKSDALREMYKGLLGKPEGRLDPSEMIARMVEIVPADGGKFRNVVPAIHGRISQGPSGEDVGSSHRINAFDRCHSNLCAGEKHRGVCGENAGAEAVSHDPRMGVDRIRLEMATDIVLPSPW